MARDLEKVYDPKRAEGNVYRRWIASGAFHADPDTEGKSYCIVIPPPNVTDKLHLGHALNNTLQDILIRQKRMAGYKTLWMPGTDHAGISTQTVVEKRILAEEGKRRTDFDREAFVARVQAWKDEYEAQILSQLKAMGCSCDWQRTRFTMDEVCARAVRAAFFMLFEDGLIYRGKRLVNWDPATQTVLADDEVEYETVQGHFWYLRYPLVEPIVPSESGQDEPIRHVTVATTRPETMLGDTAVAMSPRDPRTKYFLGKKLRLPLVGRVIPIIADDHVVLADPESDDEKAKFSTGFLKVTPAHDPDDWEIGRRHGLDVVNVLAPDGTISDRFGFSDAKGSEAEKLLGMDRFEARRAVVEWFDKEGLLADAREYTHQVGHSYRSHVPIEPYLSDQWYIAVKKPIPSLPEAGRIPGTDVPVNSLAGLALKPLLDGRIRFTPARYAKVYSDWLENLRDWPISRQLWWGHQIPVWSLTCRGPAGGEREILRKLREAKDPNLSLKVQALEPEQSEAWTADAEAPDDGHFRAYACLREDDPELIERLEQAGFLRDEDVLDTWFSSALWPFSTMGWPEKTPELKAFYPGDVLCTAREIITLWVSRMVMLGQYCLGEIPFPDVFIHAMIQDGEGRKMSKSRGNGVDPMDIIASHGADAMRFTLAYMTTQTQDVRMPVEEMTLPDGRKANTSPKFDIGRNFCNKLWNASRFALMNIQGAPAWNEISPGADLSDAWILSRLNRTARDVTQCLAEFRFHEAAIGLYRYTWNDFCDWYLEIGKIRMGGGDPAPKAVLAHALDVVLRLLHPFIPFVTEEIWSHLNEMVAYRGPGDSPAEPLLVKAAWPQPEAGRVDETAERRFAALQELITGVREARNRHDVPAGKKVRLSVWAEADDAQCIAENVALIQALAQVEAVELDPQAKPSRTDATVLAGNVRALVHDVVDRETELSRLRKRRETLRRGVASAEGRLNNDGFLSRAPQDVVARERERLESMQEELQAVEKALAQLL